jgi:hypothetical protein
MLAVLFLSLVLVGILEVYALARRQAEAPALGAAILGIMLFAVLSGLCVQRFRHSIRGLRLLKEGEAGLRYWHEDLGNRNRGLRTVLFWKNDK